jgi:hypothetical protein
LASHERLQGVRQLVRSRKTGAIDCYRDYTDIAAKRRRDLDAHKIIRIVEPPMAILVFCI